MYDLSFGHLSFWLINIWPSALLPSAWEENKNGYFWHNFFRLWLLISIYLWFLNTFTFDQLSFWPIAVRLIVAASVEKDNKNLLFLWQNFFLVTCLLMLTHWSLLYLPVAFTKMCKQCVLVKLGFSLNGNFWQTDKQYSGLTSEQTALQSSGSNFQQSNWQKVQFNTDFFRSKAQIFIQKCVALLKQKKWSVY